MQRRQRNQLAQSGDDLWRDDDRAGKLAPPWTTRWPTPTIARSPVPIAQPLGQRIERAARPSRTVAPSASSTTSWRRHRPSRRNAATCRCLRSVRGRRAASIALRAANTCRTSDSTSRRSRRRRNLPWRFLPDSGGSLRAPARMRGEHGDAAAGDARSHTVGAAGQDDRHARPEHQAGAVGIGEET